MSNFNKLKLFAGDKWTFTESFSDFPSSEYLLKIFLKKGDADSIELTSTASTDNISYIFKIPSFITEIPSGNYQYAIKAIKKDDSTDKITVEASSIYILPDLSNVGEDGRSEWRKIYDNLLEKYQEMIKAGDLYTTVSVEGRTTTLDHSSLLRMIHNAANNAGISPSGLEKKTSNKILVRF